MQIHHALFSLHIYYCLLAWATTTLGNIKTIHSLQQRARRYIANFPRSMSVGSLFDRYKIISLKHMCNFQLIYDYFFARKQFQTFIKDLLNISVQHTDSWARSMDRWLVPSSHTNCFLHFLGYTSLSVLNKYVSTFLCLQKEKCMNFLSPLHRVLYSVFYYV